MVLTVINGIGLIALIGLVVTLYNMISSFGEIILRFVEQNQEYYKNQKHLVEKVSQLAIDLKKIVGSHNEMKRSITKLQEITRTIDTKQDAELLKVEIAKISSENSKLSNVSSRIASEVSKLSSIKIKKE